MREYKKVKTTTKYPKTLLQYWTFDTIVIVGTIETVDTVSLNQPQKCYLSIWIQEMLERILKVVVKYIASVLVVKTFKNSTAE